MIQYNWTTGEWWMTKGRYPSFVAKAESPYHLLALGLDTWTVENDDNCQKTAGNIEMSLSSCKLGGYQRRWDVGADRLLWVPEEGQFTCRDGACVPLDKRCNGEYDCQVGSGLRGANSPRNLDLFACRTIVMK